MTPFQFALLTPDRTHYAGSVEAVTAPGQSGEFGVLARHVPMIAQLKAGAVRVREAGGRTLHFAVDGGMLGVEAARGVRLLAARAAVCADAESAAAPPRSFYVLRKTARKFLRST